MTPEERAKEFVHSGFRSFGVPLEPYIAIVTELIQGAVDEERERCAAILQLARFGEIDRDWRSIIHRIEDGSPAAADAADR